MKSTEVLGGASVEERTDFPESEFCREPWRFCFFRVCFGGGFFYDFCGLVHFGEEEEAAGPEEGASFFVVNHEGDYAGEDCDVVSAVDVDDSELV